MAALQWLSHRVGAATTDQVRPFRSMGSNVYSRKERTLARSPTAGRQCAHTKSRGSYKPEQGHEIDDKMLKRRL